MSSLQRYNQLEPLFVRPGYQRVGVNLPKDSKEVFGSAYISPEKDRLVVVYTNMTEKNIQIETSLEGVEGAVDSVEQLVTSESYDLEPIEHYREGLLPAKSVSTFVYSLK